MDTQFLATTDDMDTPFLATTHEMDTPFSGSVQILSPTSQGQRIKVPHHERKPIESIQAPAVFLKFMENYLAHYRG